VLISRNITLFICRNVEGLQRLNLIVWKLTEIRYVDKIKVGHGLLHFNRKAEGIIGEAGGQPRNGRKAVWTERRTSPNGDPQFCPALSWTVRQGSLARLLLLSSEVGRGSLADVRVSAFDVCCVVVSISTHFRLV
jgi:hypothetical protein